MIVDLRRPLDSHHLAVELALLAVADLLGEGALDLAAAQGAGDDPAVLAVVRVGRALTELRYLGTARFASTLLGFPAVHDRLRGECISLDASVDGPTYGAPAVAAIRSSLCAPPLYVLAVAVGRRGRVHGKLFHLLQ